MKKILALLIILALALFLVGCKKQVVPAEEPATEPVAPEVAPVEEPVAPVETPEAPAVIEGAKETVDTAAAEVSAKLKAEGGACTDTDGGLTYDQYGVVVYGKGSSKQDDCTPVPTDANRLTEYSCDENGERYVRTYYTCPNGCKDGACV